MDGYANWRQAYLMARRTRLTEDQWPEHCKAVVKVATRRLADGHDRDRTVYELRILAALRDAVEQEINTHVTLARVTGAATWRDIGESLGMTAQSAHQKFSGRPRRSQQKLSESPDDGQRTTTDDS